MLRRWRRRTRASGRKTRTGDPRSLIFCSVPATPPPPPVRSPLASSLPHHSLNGHLFPVDPRMIRIRPPPRAALMFVFFIIIHIFFLWRSHALSAAPQKRALSESWIKMFTFRGSPSTQSPRKPRGSSRLRCHAGNKRPQIYRSPPRKLSSLFQDPFKKMAQKITCNPLK